MTQERKIVHIDTMQRSTNAAAGAKTMSAQINPWQAPHLARDGTPFLAILEGSDLAVVVRRDGKRWVPKVEL